jgi:peptide/nickel transport system substrate-binding protein
LELEMITRRQLVASTGALAVPPIATAAQTKVLVFVPRTALNSLDAVWTTEQVTRAFSLAVFESLFSVDEDLNPKPQMAEGYVVEEDGKRWTIHLRSGLRFHDGEPVLARDCVASINRWMKRDAVGRSLAARLDAMEAPDDTGVVFRLKRPFAQLPFALGKAQPNVLPIMPARIAATDPSKHVDEIIGSGPFRFLPGEFSAGSFTALARFEAYEPRNETANGTAGGRRVLVERVEWRAIPDPATAANALLTGEVDWVDTPLHDLVPRLRADRKVIVQAFDPYGTYALLRPNHTQPPTNNVLVRQAIMAALDQEELMQTVTAGERSYYTVPVGCFMPGSAAENRAGMERIGGHSVAEVRTMFRQAGYNGERIVMLDPADSAPMHAMFQVIAARLSGVGFNVDDVVLDQATVVARRNHREPVEKGGWSLTMAIPTGADHLDPLVALGLRTGAAAWIGWPVSCCLT